MSNCGLMKQCVAMKTWIGVLSAPIRRTKWSPGFEQAESEPSD